MSGTFGNLFFLTVKTNRWRLEVDLSVPCWHLGGKGKRGKVSPPTATALGVEEGACCLFFLCSSNAHISFFFFSVVAPPFAFIRKGVFFVVRISLLLRTAVLISTF